MEKENKKVQQKARKERNEEIRGLVAFVRKRDKRVQAQRQLLEQRAAENRQRQAQLDLEQVMKRKQELAEQIKNQSNILDDGYEEKLRQLEKAMQSSDDEEDDDELLNNLQDVHIDMDELGVLEQTLDCEFFCVACNKTFKNQSSYRNHESSKKHKENVELIKLEMLEDDEQLQSGEEGQSEHEIVQEIEKNQVEPDVLSGVSKGKKKKQKGRAPVTRAPAESSDEEDDNKFSIAGAQSDDDGDWGASSSKAKGKSKGKPGPNKDKKPAKKEPVTKPEPLSDHESEAIDVDHKCVTCSEQFSSKNKLFMHLKKTNHGVYLPKGKVITEADVQRKGKGGKRK